MPLKILGTVPVITELNVLVILPIHAIADTRIGVLNKSDPGNKTDIIFILNFLNLAIFYSKI